METKSEYENKTYSFVPGGHIVDEDYNADKREFKKDKNNQDKDYQYGQSSKAMRKRQFEET